MSVREFVDSEVENKKAVMFSKSFCPFCKRAKATLASEFPDLDVEIYEIDEREDGEAIQAYLAEKSGQRTVPNIFINKKHVGGNDDLQAKIKNGEVAALINA